MTRYGDADVADILAAHGLTPRPDGYSLLELERFATARGWPWSVEPVSGRPAGRNPKKRFRAMVISSGEDRAIDPWRGKLLGMRQTRAIGASDTAALTLALARMLAATAEHGS